MALANETRNAFCDSIATNATDQLHLTYPGVAYLGAFNDLIHSYHCLAQVDVGMGMSA
jgi:hypothetical protein